MALSVPSPNEKLSKIAVYCVMMEIMGNVLPVSTVLISRLCNEPDNSFTSVQLVGFHQVRKQGMYTSTESSGQGEKNQHVARNCKTKIKHAAYFHVENKMAQSHRHCEKSSFLNFHFIHERLLSVVHRSVNLELQRLL